MPICRDRSRTTCRRRAARVATARRRTASCSTTTEDVERQFGLSARSRLTRRDRSHPANRCADLDRKKAARRRGRGHRRGDPRARRKTGRSIATSASRRHACAHRDRLARGGDAARRATRTTCRCFRRPCGLHARRGAAGLADAVCSEATRAAPEDRRASDEAEPTKASAPTS